MTKIPNSRLRHDLGTAGAPKKTSSTVTAKIQRMCPPAPKKGKR